MERNAAYDRKEGKKKEGMEEGARANEKVRPSRTHLYVCSQRTFKTKNVVKVERRSNLACARHPSFQNLKRKVNQAARLQGGTRIGTHKLMEYF